MSGVALATSIERGINSADLPANRCITTGSDWRMMLLKHEHVFVPKWLCFHEEFVTVEGLFGGHYVQKHNAPCGWGMQQYFCKCGEAGYAIK